MSRFDDARFIIGGACNPVAVCGSLHKAMLECSKEGLDHSATVNDPAVVLIFDQFSQLMGYAAITHPDKFAAAWAAVRDKT